MDPCVRADPAEQQASQLTGKSLISFAKSSGAVTSGFGPPRGQLRQISLTVGRMSGCSHLFGEDKGPERAPVDLVVVEGLLILVAQKASVAPEAVRVYIKRV